MTPKRLFIVDAMAMAFRNFHAFGVRPMTTSSGLPTSSIFGCAQFLIKLCADEKPDYLVIATDSPDKTFRHELYPLYKANRSEMPEDLSRQIPHLFEMFNAMGCKLLKQPGVEADDLIGSLVRKYRSPDLHCYIVSGDKDFMQLIDSHTFLYIPQKGGTAKLVGEAGVQEKFGCAPGQVIDVLALMGDASDNIPGVHGVGEKGASKLIAAYSSLEGIYDHLSDIKNEKLRLALETSKDLAFLSRKLATIDTECEPLPVLSDLSYHPDQLASQTLHQFFQAMEFRKLSDDTAQRIAAVEKVQAASERVTIAQSDVRANYLLVVDQIKLSELTVKLAQASHFAFDTETTGLDIVGDKPIGMSFSVEHGKAYYVPLVASHGQTIPTEEILRQIRPYLEDPAKIKVAHNLKFDLQMMQNLGISIDENCADTLIASYLLNTNSRTHSLDACAAQYFQYTKIPTSSLIGKNAAASMLDVEIERLSDYACEDADFTLRLYECLIPKLREQGLDAVFRGIEMPLVFVLAKMERRGMFVDPTTLGGLAESLTAAIAKVEAEIHQHAGEAFNINSTKQLQQILFEKLKLHEALGLTRLKKTKSGFSTDVSVLEKLSAHPMGQALLEYRSLTKLLGTYVEALPELINGGTGRIHTSFHQWGTATGRLSSSEPNFQNIPIRTPNGREIRRAFKSDKEDHVIISADYSQIELRILAHLADDENLIEAFQNGADIHTSTAAKIFNTPVADVDKNMRNQAKAINFGIIYGMGANRLARETGVSYKQAEEFITKYFEGYPRIRGFINGAIAEAKANHCTRTITGRMRPFVIDDNAAAFGNPENIAVNTPIQGSAADLIKIAMIRLEEEFAKEGLNARMLLQVHDELVFECPRDEADEAAQVIRRVMQDAMSLKVPLIVDIGIGNTWLEAH